MYCGKCFHCLLADIVSIGCRVGGWNFGLKIMLNKIKQVSKLKTKFPMISVKLIMVAQ